MVRKFTPALLPALLVALALAATSAAQLSVTRGEVTSGTFVVKAIDYKARTITFTREDGTTGLVYVEPAVKRFDGLKAGDKVTIRYHESLVVHIQVPGALATPPSGPTFVPKPGAKPQGTISQQMTALVTIEAIDMKGPSVTVRDEDGSTVSFKVEDRKNLAGLKVGDKVQITYTEALAVSVESAGR